MSILDFILFGLSIIVFAAGAVFMIHQVFCGLDKTALNDKYVWGMNIQGFYLQQGRESLQLLPLQRCTLDRT